MFNKLKSGFCSLATRWKLSPVALLALVLALTCVVGATLAYLMVKTDIITNLFNPVRVECEASQMLDSANHLTKEDGAYHVKNTGTLDAFIRVALVTNWVDANGNVYPEQPAVTVTYSNDFWTKIGEYYYFRQIVPVGEFTKEIKVSNNQTPPAGYTIQVQVLAEAVQYTPLTAVEDAWDVTFDEATFAWSAQ